MYEDLKEYLNWWAAAAAAVLCAWPPAGRMQLEAAGRALLGATPALAAARSCAAVGLAQHPAA
jgi:hypothetical protein